MPLFTSHRDIGLMTHLNCELIEKMIDTPISYYKLSGWDTVENLYGEAINKFYFPSISVAAIIEHDAPNVDTSEAGPNKTQNIRVKFNRNMLKTLDLYPEEGDVIEWNARQYLITSIIEDRFVGGQTKEGWNWSIICGCVLQKRSVAKVEEIKRHVNNEPSLYR